MSSHTERKCARCLRPLQEGYDCLCDCTCGAPSGWRHLKACPVAKRDAQSDDLGVSK